MIFQEESNMAKEIDSTIHYVVEEIAARHIHVAEGVPVS